jgi:DMSO reductase anchor subunit
MDTIQGLPPPPSYASITDKERQSSVVEVTQFEAPATDIERRTILRKAKQRTSHSTQSISTALSEEDNLWELLDTWWLWELLSWCCAAACLGAIAILLAVYSGRPVPEWRWGLTLNSYISILGTYND